LRTQISLTLRRRDFTSVGTQAAFIVFGMIAALAATAFVLFRVGMPRLAALAAVLVVLGLANAIYRLVGF
jgi:hypothetical protein